MSTDENGLEYESLPLKEVPSEEMINNEKQEPEYDVMERENAEGWNQGIPRRHRSGNYHSYNIPQIAIKAQENEAAVRAGQEPPNKYWENPQNIVEGRGGYNGETPYERAKHEAKKILTGNDVKAITDRLNEEELARKLERAEQRRQKEDREAERMHLELELKAEKLRRRERENSMRLQELEKRLERNTPSESNRRLREQVEEAQLNRRLRDLKYKEQYAPELDEYRLRKSEVESAIAYRRAQKAKRYGDVARAIVSGAPSVVALTPVNQGFTTVMASNTPVLAFVDNAFAGLGGFRQMAPQAPVPQPQEQRPVVIARVPYSHHRLPKKRRYKYKIIKYKIPIDEERERMR